MFIQFAEEYFTDYAAGTSLGGHSGTWFRHSAEFFISKFNTNAHE
jgi:hypothetical protein